MVLTWWQCWVGLAGSACSAAYIWWLAANRPTCGTRHDLFLPSVTTLAPCSPSTMQGKWADLQPPVRVLAVHPRMENKPGIGPTRGLRLWTGSMQRAFLRGPRAQHTNGTGAGTQPHTPSCRCCARQGRHWGGKANTPKTIPNNATAGSNATTTTPQ